MTEIPSKRRRSKQSRRSRQDDAPAIIDPVAVKAWLDSLVARWTVLGICAVLIGLMVLVYGQVLKHDFIDLGDKTVVTSNPLVTSGLKFGAIFHVLTHFDSGFFTPLTMISHMADWQFYGRFYGQWAGGHHLTNALLHGATVILFFLTLRLVTGAIWRSAFVTMLFAIHPLQVESISWLAQRNDVLCGLFFVLTISAYIRYVYRPWSLARYLSVMAMFVLGLMASPMLVSLPFVLLLLDYWPLGRYSQPAFINEDGPQRPDFISVFLRLFTEKIPFFAVSFLVFLLTLIARRQVHDSLDTFSLMGRISNTTVSSLLYLGKAIYPGNLAAFYPQATDSIHFFEFLFAAILLFVITAGALFFHKKYPYLIVGWLWYLGMLLPAIGWGAGGLFAGSDHYFYLPSVGLFIIVAWGGWDLCSLLPRRAWAAAGAMIIVGGLLTACARKQCSYWMDGESLWHHALDATSDNYMAYDNLAIALAKKGNYEDAILNFEKAIAIRPEYAEAHDSLGSALVEKGNLKEAIAHFQKALEIQPNSAKACIHLGIALAEKGSLDEAVSYFNRALEILPNDAEAHYNLGTTLALKGDLPGAVAHFQKALEILPYYAEAHYNLGLALTHQGDLTGAIAHFKKALENRPNYPEANFNLGIAFFQNNDVDDAIIHWQKALIIQPNYEEAHYYLGIALTQQGNFDEAIAHFERALEVGPNYAEIYNSLGSAQLQKKEFFQACIAFQKAVDIDPGYLLARNNLAWVLATCMNPSVRDGRRAIELVDRTARATGNKYPALLRTLAAAYAEGGRFPEAVETAKQALKGYDEKTDAQAVEGIRNEIKLYQAGSPYHETP